MINYTKETLEAVRERGLEESNQKWFSGGSTRIGSEEEFQRYIEEEIKLIEVGAALKAIKA